MAKRREDEVPDFIGFAQELKRDVVSYTAVTGLNFFIDSFQNQGFTNASFEPWQKRNNDTRPGGALLVKSSNLRNSLKVMDRSSAVILFGSNSPYAKIHNEGGTINLTLSKKARKFFWFMYYATNDSRYKWMAISKKDHLIVKIPKRQFIGHSETLMSDLETWFKNEIEKRFKNI